MARLKFPKIRNPFANPLHINKLHKKFFGKGKTKKKRSLWRKIGIGAIWAVCLGILGLVFLFAWFAKDLPTPGKIKTLVSSSSTRLFDRNMKALYTISGEQKRIIIDQKDIPDNVRQATIALEDRNFYTDPGISVRGIARSVYIDLLRGGKAQGGSTITQQYVRLALLQDTRKNFTRKIKEAILAVEVDALFSKDQILTMYLNEIPYGGNNYGIEAAAHAFYGKSAKDLDLAQAATLAALPQQPSTLSPYGPNTQKLIARRNYAIDTMVQMGFITTDQANQAKGEALGVIPQHDSIVAPHFVLYVKSWLVDYFTQQLGDQQLAEQKVEEGGLTVVTTLDLDKQKIAEDAVSQAVGSTLKRAGASNAAVVTIDPKRGEVISMVGSVDYYQPQFGAFNVATAFRQPGSSFKPIVYATAFKDKYDPATTLFDLKTNFGGNYSPDNYDGKFHGPVTIRQALGNSLNIPAVKALGLVGIDKALKTASDLGITSLTNTKDYGLSLALGAGEVSPLQMAGAYGVFANNGTLMPTTPVLKITDTNSKVIYDHSDPKDGRQVLDPQIAFEINNILSDVEAKKPEFANVLNVLTLKDRPAAVKTGTSQNFVDAWTIGYTPQYVTAVWAGNNDNTPMNKAIGAIAAAPIWVNVMQQYHQGLPVETFNQPNGIQQVSVDRFSNKLPVNGSDVISDIFASWQVPTDKDDVHQQVRVCRENGLLADSSIPDELAEIRTYTYVHSEKPNDPNWEGPVRAWAIANGYNNAPPTGKCNPGDTSVTPSITITSPADHSTVNGKFTISANASAPSGVRQVEFLIDNTSIATVTDSPYQTSYDSTNLSNGDHTIAATVTSNSGSTATARVTISLSKDTTPPANVSSFNGCVNRPDCPGTGIGSGKVYLSWVNPTDSDLKLIRIYISNGLNGSPIRSIDVASPTQNVTVTGLTPGTAYRFIAKSVDTNGNESSGAGPIILTPP